MCLHKVTKRFKKNDRIRTGYKVFCKVGSDLSDEYYYHNPYFNVGRLRRLGRAYFIPDDINIKIGPYIDRQYESGYHIYDSKDDAIESMSYEIAGVVCEVIGWDIRAYGWQNRKKCFVSQNYRIMREVASRY